jgi:tetratricopeptide (TPR) repeat protein
MNDRSEEKIRLANALFEQRRFSDAFEMYRVLAESGSVSVQLRVAWMLQTGCGVKSNSDEAYHWYLQAAESNSPEALFYIGRFKRAEKQYEQALQYFEASARQNYAPSIYQLGVMYELGEGVDADINKAFTYYDHAATMGHLRAQRDKAVFMLKGKFGLRRIPEGLLMLLRFFRNSIKLISEDPYSDNVRW